MEKVDITIIGAGVVGLAIAERLSRKHSNLLQIERHSSFGQETSSRNSEVIHAGIYYPQKYLKGRLCIEGNEMLYSLCKEHDIPFKNTGKLIVATDKNEESFLVKLLSTAQKNGAKEVRIIDADEIKQMEPNVAATAALWCPTTGIVDSHRLMQFFEASAINRNANIVYGTEADSITKSDYGYIVETTDRSGADYSFETKILINAAGLSSDKIASLAGIDIEEADYELHPNKGIYFRVTKNLDKFPSALIYPTPPSPGNVGIHTTPDLAGGMRLGPHFYWTDKLDYIVDESFKQFFFESAVKYLPFLQIDDLQPDIGAIYPTRQNPCDKMKDFIIKHEIDRGLDNFINLVGIDSPGLTASPAIAKMVGDMVEELL